MNTDVFEYLSLLLEEGSFSRAAKRIPMSQQGLSKAVKALERELGVPLVTRGPGKIRLTSQGEELYPAIRALAELSHTLSMRAAPLASEVRKANAPTLLVSPLVSWRILPFLEQHFQEGAFLPEDIREESLENMISAIEADNSIIGFGHYVIGREPAGLRSLVSVEDLFSAETCICASPSLVSRGTDFFSSEMLHDIPIVNFNDPLLNDIIECFRLEGRVTKVLRHSSNLPALLKMADSGEAVMLFASITAFLSKDSKDFAGLDIGFYPMESPARINIALFRNNSLKSGSPGLALVNQLKTLVQNSMAPYIDDHPPVLQ